MIYDEDRDAFIQPKPFNSWTLNEETCVWEAPVAYPNDGQRYSWNEENRTWQVIDNSLNSLITLGMSKESKKFNIVNDFIDLIVSSIRDTLTGDTFFWFYNDFVNYRPCEGYKFSNEIIKDSNLTSRIFVNYLQMIRPVLEKISQKITFSKI